MKLGRLKQFILRLTKVVRPAFHKTKFCMFLQKCFINKGRAGSALSGTFYGIEKLSFVA